MHWNSTWIVAPIGRSQGRGDNVKPIRTIDTNRIFKLVGGTDDNDLPVFQAEDEDGTPVLISTWELTDEERIALVAGGHVELLVWGIGTPPVALRVREMPNGS